ncbi:hypothetical protein ANSO36C_27960 [Nostoc cf. commune SO-36]|uniref:Transposase n=1 Tax=Nostoc cf. commune SO-36 TaxID=449208 RepID=A0ABM7Z1Y6_NOSCO|nr:hypothetical protein ANSO36C_27960 [Nostoc cf. commune SO-36]
MKITKHRQKILDALQQWFSIHKQGSSLDKVVSITRNATMSESNSSTLVANYALNRWLLIAKIGNNRNKHNVFLKNSFSI